MSIRKPKTFAFLLATVALTIGAAAAVPSRIVFTRDGGFGSRLFLAAADGTGEKRLLDSSGLDYNPAWSPDGRWIAFTSERRGSADLFRVKRDGSTLEQLTSDSVFDDQAAWSPDATQLVFVTTRAGGTADLWTLNVSTKAAKPLTSGRGADLRPSWSPDGNWIAFSSDRDRQVRLQPGGFVQQQLASVYVIRPDGSGLRRVTTTDDFCGSPAWAADSRSLVAACMSGADTVDYRVGTGPAPAGAGHTRLTAIDLATGAMTDIVTGAGVKISPRALSTGTIAFVRQDNVNPGVFYNDGRTGPVVTRDGAVRTASWSPDGTRIVYDRRTARNEGEQRSGWRSLWSRLPEYELIHSQLLSAFDPSGDHFVTTRDAALFLGEARSPQLRPLFRDQGKRVFAGAWSPGGQEIVMSVGLFFQHAPDRGAQVATVKRDGSGYRELTTGLNNNGFPSYAPDGTHVVYRTVGPEGQGLRILDIAGGAITTLTTEYDTFPAWSPQRNLIAFIRRIDGDFELFTIRSDGTQLHRLTRWPGNEGHPSWSPDGERIVFASGRMGFKDESFYTDCPQPYGEIFTIRYDGTGAEQLTDNQWEDGGPTWPRNVVLQSAK